MAVAMSMAASDYEVFKNALVYTLAVEAVNRVVKNRDGSILALLASAMVLTLGAQLASGQLGAATHKHEMVQPIYACFAFVTKTLVSIGINMQSTLLGAYLATMFPDDIDPLFVLVVSTTGLVMLWVLGVAVSAAE